MVECPNCASAVPEGARFCPECGRPLRDSEEGARRRTVVDPFLIVVAFVAVGGVVLAVTGAPVWGLVVVLLAGVLFLTRRELERQRAGRALGALRARAAAAGEAVAARSREQVELFRARRELAELEAERARRLRDLGHAVFQGDETGTESARAAVAAVVERIREKEAEIETLREETERRVERAQVQSRPTERMESSGEPGHVPEPWPPPDEGDVPDPAPTPPPPEPPPAPEEPRTRPEGPSR